MLHISDLSVAFRRYAGVFSQATVPVLDRIQVDVYPGEIVAVCGESGAGKSLLANAITGVLPPGARVSGQIEWAGPHELGEHVRLIPQGVSAFDPTMPIGRFVGNDAALDRFGLSAYAQAYPAELSGGQLRRALLATSVGEHTRLIIADEPTPGLHPEAVDTALDYFAELRAQGTSVLLITHDLAAARRVADRMIILRNGAVVDSFPTQHLAEATGYTRELWEAQPANNFWVAAC